MLHIESASPVYLPFEKKFYSLHCEILSLLKQSRVTIHSLTNGHQSHTDECNFGKGQRQQNTIVILNNTAAYLQNMCSTSS